LEKSVRGGLIKIDNGNSEQEKMKRVKELGNRVVRGSRFFRKVYWNWAKGCSSGTLGEMDLQSPIQNLQIYNNTW